MSTKFKYGNDRPINGDYFTIKKGTTAQCKYDLDFFINRINFDDYYIFKSSNRQRQVSVEDFKEFKYSGYIFFKKDLFNPESIMEWADSDFMVHYLSRPVPPFPPSKIIYRSINR